MPTAVHHSQSSRDNAGMKAKVVWLAVGILCGATAVGAAWRVLTPAKVPTIALADRAASPATISALPAAAQTTANAPMPSLAAAPTATPKPQSTPPPVPSAENPPIKPATLTPAVEPDDPDHKPVEIVQQPGPIRAPGEKININSANAEELALLPGIGPKLAAAIVSDRAKNGKFKKVTDLDRVKGIGKKKLDAIRSSITVE